MATHVVDQSAAVRSRPVAAARSTFYVWMAGAITVIAIGSFIPTYWAQLPAGTFVGTPLVHLHAAVFTAWPLFLLSQATLVARGQIRHHKTWGMAGISLATMVVLIGMSTAIGSMHSRVVQGYAESGRAFAIIPISSIVMFSGFVIAAIACVTRPEWHKRWMLLASIALLQAPLARIVFLAKTGGGAGLRPGLGAPAPVSGPWLAAVLMDLLIVAAIAYDWRRRGKPHPAWLIGGAAIVLIQLLRVPLSTSSAWQTFAAALEGFA